MAKVNQVHLVADAIHIVHESGSVTKLYHYATPTELEPDDVRDVFGDMGEPLCTIAELVEALGSIKNAR